MPHPGTLLRGIRLARGLTVDAMAVALGTSARHLDLVEEGAAFPSAGERRAWAKPLGFADLLAFDDGWRVAGGWAHVRAAMAARGEWVPVINKAPAGPAGEYDEWGVDSGFGYEYVARPTTGEGAADPADPLFAVVVVGDSMAPALADGDLAVFRPVGLDETVPDAATVFVRLTAGHQNACAVTTITRRPDGRFDLRPVNPAHAATVIGPDEIDRLAVLVERRPNFWDRPRAEPRRVTDEYSQIV